MGLATANGDKLSFSVSLEWRQVEEFVPTGMSQQLALFTQVNWVPRTWKVMATYHVYLHCQMTYMAIRNQRKLDMGMDGGTARLEVLRNAAGEESISSASRTVANDRHGSKPTGSPRLDEASTETTRMRLRNVTKIATWNVRSMLSGKLKTVIREAERHNINVIGIAEHRWAGQGHFHPEEGGIFVFSGREQPGHSGVGVYLAGATARSLMGYNPISDGVLVVRLHARPTNITIIQVYAPTSAAMDEEVDHFYEVVQEALDDTPATDFLVLLDDFNAKIGEGMDDGEEATIGRFGLGSQNERGEHLISFATDNELTVCNTLFEQHKRQLYTWTSPDGKTRNQIDYILIRKGKITCVRNTRTFTGADCGSDHHLLCVDVRYRVKKRKRDQPVARFNMNQIPQAFSVEVSNRFEELSAAADEMTPNELWERTKDAMLSVAQKHVPKKKPRRATWMTKETMELIENRRKMKAGGRSIASTEY